MKAYIFPGQGAQFKGMGRELSNDPLTAPLFSEASELIGFDLSHIMVEGTDDELKQTKVTQPAVFLHSVATAVGIGPAFKPDMVAGHSLGEFSALVAAKALSFTEGFKLVMFRAAAMQKACEETSSTMAAIIGLDDDIVVKICAKISESYGIVVPANYNCPGQLVISGSTEAVAKACEALKEAGAKRALPLQVGGAFHSPLMEPARKELQEAIRAAAFSRPACPVYQNVDGLPHQEVSDIRQNLVDQLTFPVLWTQAVRAMIAGGATKFIEVGPGKVLQGLVKKINSDVQTASA